MYAGFNSVPDRLPPEFLGSYAGLTAASTAASPRPPGYPSAPR